MAQSDAERQHAARERRRVERLRAEMRELAGEACACCGEANPVFLTRLEQGVYCLNCARPTSHGWVCPHRGISRRLG